MADLPSWQIALAATWLLLQACILPSLPEEIVITSLGVLVAQGRIGAPLATAAVLAGLLPADAVPVFLGGLARRRAGGGGILGRCQRSTGVEGALAALRRRGSSLVVATRFTPFVRGPIYLATGLSGLGVGRFLLLDAAAACVQVPILLWIGSRLGRDTTAKEAWGRVGWLSTGLVAVALAIALVHLLRGRRSLPIRHGAPRPSG
jgi:membrane protein DedA with SNARE-associated domain